ncbi:DUF2190 family protein [bacterium]|nr:DUF2190 family protein [bacterium]
MRIFPLLAVTRIAAADVAKNTLVTVSGAYPTAIPAVDNPDDTLTGAGAPTIPGDQSPNTILGVADTDAKAGDLVTIIVQGYVAVKAAAGATFTLGKNIGVDIAGKAVAPGSENAVVAAFRPVLEIENNHVYILL